jgi:hypothetical protein
MGGRKIGSKNSKLKTHCKNGHEFTPENTYITRIGSRDCRACQRNSKKRHHSKMLARKHGLTLDQKKQMLLEQEGKCPVCSTDKPGGQGDWHIHHDHECCPGKYSCGKCVQALLCSACNRGMGCLGDDPKRLRRAADLIEVKRAAT